MHTVQCTAILVEFGSNLQIKVFSNSSLQSLDLYFLDLHMRFSLKFKGEFCLGILLENSIRALCLVTLFGSSVKRTLLGNSALPILLNSALRVLLRRSGCRNALHLSLATLYRPLENQPANQSSIKKCFSESVCHRLHNAANS